MFPPSSVHFLVFVKVTVPLGLEGAEIAGIFGVSDKLVELRPRVESPAPVEAVAALLGLVDTHDLGVLTHTGAVKTGIFTLQKRMLNSSIWKKVKLLKAWLKPIYLDNQTRTGLKNCVN